MRVNSSTCVSFDPEAIEDLYAAFLRAWNFIKASEAASYLDEGAAQACLAKHIIAIACCGETNVLRVANLAIARFRNKKTNSEMRPSEAIFYSQVIDSNLRDDLCPRGLLTDISRDRFGNLAD